MHASRSVTVFLFVMIGCSASDVRDAAPSDVARACATARDCDDGRFCNGVEMCAAGACVAGTAPCAGACDEATDVCSTGCATDADGDGARSIACGGTDCDDAEPRRFPGNAEICDADGLDEDCDPTTFGPRDSDGDGYVSSECCNGASCGADCDDGHGGVHPFEAESCEGLDNDCDGAVDEGVGQTYYEDSDGDGYGAVAGMTRRACAQPDGYAASSTDCDDVESPLIHPGVPDGAPCDGVDDNCRDGVDEDCNCTPGATRDCPEQRGVCMGMSQTCGGDMRWSSCPVIDGSAERCNGLDDDCDGLTDDEPAVPNSCRDTVQHAVETCEMGACAYDVCDRFFGDCDGSEANGCETPVTTLARCGECGRACDMPRATESCADGRCRVVDCEMGYQNCNDLAPDGCECGGLANTVSACVVGTCEVDCQPRYLDCDARDATGCECGPLPNGEAACNGTSCWVACHTGFLSCDGSPENGCECGPNLQCSGSACTGACQPGFNNCDGSLENGCECPSPRSCSGSACI